METQTILYNHGEEKRVPYKTFERVTHWRPHTVPILLQAHQNGWTVQFHLAYAQCMSNLFSDFKLNHEEI